MRSDFLLAIFVVSCTNMPLSTCTAPGRGTHWYLREFLNTTEGIWTYASTSTRTVTCEVNKMKYISTSEIIYQRKFLWGEKRCEVDLQGQFFRSYDDRMTVQSPYEKLRFDVRVRNSSLVRAEPHVECRRHFNRARRPRLPYHLYSPRCQHVFYNTSSDGAMISI
uniref:Putative lipocalin n=1 Tax=Rhipicephalus microplus TaxID=6941 RepID=A0A6G5A4Q1_RHIMP